MEGTKSQAGSQKKLYTIYNFSPPKKYYLCIITFLNAWGLVTGTAALPDERCLSFKTEVLTCFYLCSVRIVSGPIFRIFLLRTFAKTERKLNVSLAYLIRSCPFTQGHSGVFRLLIVFILRFVKTGTPTLLSFPDIRSDPAPCKNRYTHSLIIRRYSVGSSALKNAKRDGSFKFFCPTIRESFLHYFQVTKVSD